MVDQGNNGYVVENDSLEQLAAAMENMLTRTPEDLAQAGNRSYELFDKFFLDAHVAAEFEAFYNEILSK